MSSNNTAETQPAPAVAAPNVEQESETQNTISGLIKTVEGFVVRDREMVKTLKGLLQSYNREIKSLKKKSTRKTIAKSGTLSKRAKRERMEVPADPKLLAFLGKGADAKVSVVEARKSICDYVRAHNLQDQSNKHKINPDANLQNVLGPAKYIFEHGEKGYSYLNLPRYLGDLLTFPAEQQAASTAA